jgi:hypothetical protein
MPHKLLRETPPRLLADPRVVAADFIPGFSI